MKISLRDYQARLISQVSHHLTSGGDALIEQPTGSGKTLEIVGISAATLNDKFSHIVIAAPQQQIEEGFLSIENKTLEFPTNIGATSSTIEVSPDLILQLRDNGRDGVVPNLKRYLNNTLCYTIVCTHQSLTYEKPENILPLSLVGYLLVIDEAHHASADGLGELIELWKARGGSLLYATATPFRKDGRPVLREGMKLFRRFIAQHMEEGFAPAELNNEIIGVSVPDEVSALEFTGEEITETHRALVIDAIYDAWVRDGKPKAIIRVPSGNSQEFIADLTQKFSGVQILNGAGTDNKDKERFIKGLTDPSEKSYTTSKYDLVVGVQRVLEGTDWSVCSHVYCVGVPGSLTTVVQLIGRALRKKEDTHPIKDKAKVSFFVLGANEKSLKNLEIKHSRHALLTCVFMADYHLGSEWIVNKQIINGIKSGLKNGEITPSIAGELETETNATPISPEDRANISLFIIDAITSTEESGNKAPTVEEIIEIIKSKDEFNFDDDTINQIVTENLASRNDQIGERVRNSFASISFKPGIDKEKKRIFNQVVDEFRNETLDNSLISIGIKNQLHKITGGNIKEFCKKLLHNAKLPITEEQVIQWANAYKTKYGKFPSNKKIIVEDAPYYITWETIDACFRFTLRGLGKFSSLHEFLISKGEKIEKEPLTEEKIIEWALKYKEKYGSFPTDRSGIIEWSSCRDTWSRISGCLRVGNRGLQKYKGLNDLLTQKGYKLYKEDLTEEKVIQWALLHKEKYGKLPSRVGSHKTDSNLNQIDSAPGETWNNIDNCFRNKNRGLGKSANSLVEFFQEFLDKKTSLSETKIAEWIALYKEKYKKYPSNKSGIVEWDNRETWASIDSNFQNEGRSLIGYKSLHDYCVKKCGKIISQDFKEEDIIEAINNFIGKNKKCPIINSGFIPELGVEWKIINQRLKNQYRNLKGYTGLLDFCQQHFKEYIYDWRSDSSKKSILTEEQILEWALKYKKEFEISPTNNSGAVKYTKEYITWAAINAALKYNLRGLSVGLSLEKYLKNKGVSVKKVRKTKLPNLDKKTILDCVNKYRSESGTDPNQRSGIVVGIPDITWNVINQSFTYGRRGLTGYKSLSDFIKKECKNQ